MDSDRVRLTHELTHGELTSALFLRSVVDRRLSRLRTDSWTTAAESLDGLPAPLQRAVAPGSETVVVELGAALVHLSLGGGWVHAQLAAEDEPALDAALADLRRLLYAPDPDASQEVPVVFWTYGPHGPQPVQRSIAVPEWSEIERNYASATRARLDGLMRHFEPAHGGQLVLWHGKAGTGKTYALRALAWEWRRWCELHYIVDPDSFFGQHADYLMNVLLQPSYVGFPEPMLAGDAGIRVDLAGDLLDDGEHPAERPWKLLVLEDTGELLTPDAKSIIGQGLSRFLNVVDGLIGQGLRVLVLVTTNEEIRTLHPAVARPGRCAANVEFTSLPADEASAWLAEHGVEGTVERPTALASLYARLEGYDAAAAAREAGFAPTRTD